MQMGNIYLSPNQYSTQSFKKHYVGYQDSCKWKMAAVFKVPQYKGLSYRFIQICSFKY